MPRKTKAELLLERAAEAGSATAAVQLDRMHARRDRERRKPTLTELRAQDRDERREAQSTARGTAVIGPDHREGYAERLLAWMSAVDPDVEEGRWLSQAEDEYRAACAAFDWPEHTIPFDTNQEAA